MDSAPYDPVMEEALPPVDIIDIPPEDPEPGVRQEYQWMEAELDVFERDLPDAPKRRRDQPDPTAADRAEDLLEPRSRVRPRHDGFGGVLEWHDDGAWNDRFGLDVVEDF